ncbi:phosphoribosylamine--glycine ligase [Fusibacter sp. 3D3]|uniref:phosphoribosylamine--glycine ligase n=1 Tax=Fusibacter sp. 3D3 TaxID=1048380 RepID=UPI000853BFED|nr:phosphoribosylamine--glycine ligase [Fusibacter sp. 3D3]
MKVFIIGSGGREHAICHKILESPKVEKIFVAPGNAGISEIAECVNIHMEDTRSLLAFAQKEQIDLTIVGPEAPLVAGIVDAFEAEGLKIFGPNKKAAQFEGSKAFTKDFLIRHGIPTAPYKEYLDVEKAIEELDQFGFPVVIKADGLAAGKGVIIAQNKAEAQKALREIMSDKIFGDSGNKVVLEAFLTGIEASILCFVDGETILPMAPAQDYKKAFNHDLGPNTGGMGTYSPSQIIDDEMMLKIKTRLLDPFIKGIHEDGIDFKGILFIGIMIKGDEINVIEYNVRFGDPETEVTLPRLENDLMEVFEAVVAGRLDQIELKWKPEHAVCVIIASEGYPDAYEKGIEIKGTHEVENATVYHCGTKSSEDKLLSNGGRVLGVTALGNTLEQAQKSAYEAAKCIDFPKSFYRTDIGDKIEL